MKVGYDLVFIAMDFLHHIKLNYYYPLILSSRLTFPYYPPIHTITNYTGLLLLSSEPNAAENFTSAMKVSSYNDFKFCGLLKSVIIDWSRLGIGWLIEFVVVGWEMNCIDCIGELISGWWH